MEGKEEKVVEAAEEEEQRLLVKAKTQSTRSRVRVFFKGPSRCHVNRKVPGNRPLMKGM